MIKTYEDAEKFLEQHPDHKELMKATLVAFEAGYTQALQDILQITKGKTVDAINIISLLVKSLKRTKFLYAGNMRPDLATE